MWTDNFLLKRSVETFGEVRQFLVIGLTEFVCSLDEQTSKKVQRQNSVKRREDKIVDLERRSTK